MTQVQFLIPRETRRKLAALQGRLEKQARIDRVKAGPSVAQVRGRSCSCDREGCCRG